MHFKIAFVVGIKSYFLLSGICKRDPY